MLNITRYFQLNGLVPINNPVLVYQMGKVASSSIYKSLKKARVANVFHVHRINPENINTVKQEHEAKGLTAPDDSLGLALYRYLVRKNLPAKIISLVREPIGRNLSAYFENLDSFEGMHNAHAQKGVEELIEGFLIRYKHDVPLNWFDDEMKNTFGLDVYEHDFPFEVGCQVFANPPYEFLIMRYDLDDVFKGNMIRDFLGLESFEIHNANVASSKKYADKYSGVLTSIKVPADYAVQMLSSRYAKHFFSNDERVKLFSKWTGKMPGLLLD